VTSHLKPRLGRGFLYENDLSVGRAPAEAPTPMSAVVMACGPPDGRIKRAARRARFASSDPTLKSVGPDCRVAVRAKIEIARSFKGLQRQTPPRSGIDPQRLFQWQTRHKRPLRLA
jgi:hypothetical protein